MSYIVPFIIVFLIVFLVLLCFYLTKVIKNRKSRSNRKPEKTSPGVIIDHFKGEHLDRLLLNYDLKRLPDEDDLTFRKRIFPDLFLRLKDSKDQWFALDVLYGCVHTELDQFTKDQVGYFLRDIENKKNNQLRKAIERLLNYIH